MGVEREGSAYPNAWIETVVVESESGACPDAHIQTVPGSIRLPPTVGPDATKVLHNDTHL